RAAGNRGCDRRAGNRRLARRAGGLRGALRPPLRRRARVRAATRRAGSRRRDRRRDLYARLRPAPPLRREPRGRQAVATRDCRESSPAPLAERAAPPRRLRAQRWVRSRRPPLPAGGGRARRSAASPPPPRAGALAAACLGRPFLRGDRRCPRRPDRNRALAHLAWPRPAARTEPRFPPTSG